MTRLSISNVALLDELAARMVARMVESACAWSLQAAAAGAGAV